MKKYISWIFIFIIIISFSIYIYYEEKDNNINIDYCESKELFCEYYEDAYKLIESMTIDEKLGQLFIARYEDQYVNDELNNYYPGGYMLYSHDFYDITKSEFIEKIEFIQKKSKIPLAFGTDEEGGVVKRLSWFEEFASYEYLSPKSYYKKGGMEKVIEMENYKINDMKSAHLNYNYSPVLDISDKTTSFIYERSLSGDINVVNQFAEEVTNLYKSNDFTATVKHFPGYGNNKDTHGLVVEDNREASIIKKEAEPFKIAIDNGIPWIQMSHIIYTSFDEKYPATISKIMHDYLRNELNFSGLIVTDDMEMGGLNGFTVKEKLLLSIKCGNNFMMTSNISKYFEILKEAYKEGEITDKDIDDILVKNLAWKYKYKIIEK